MPALFASNYHRHHHRRHHHHHHRHDDDDDDDDGDDDNDAGLDKVVSDSLELADFFVGLADFRGHFTGRGERRELLLFPAPIFARPKIETISSSSSRFTRKRLLRRLVHYILCRSHLAMQMLQISLDTCLRGQSRRALLGTGSCCTLPSPAGFLFLN